MPTITGVPAVRKRAFCAGVKGKRRNCTEEALPSAVVFSRVGIGDAGDALAADGEEHVVLDLAEPGQRAVALRRVFDLEHHRGDQLVAFGDQRVVGVELVLDLRLAAALDVQHLLHLQPHRVEALEIEGAIGPDIDAARALRLADAAAMLAALGGILLGRQDVGAGDLALWRHGGAP